MGYVTQAGEGFWRSWDCQRGVQGGPRREASAGRVVLRLKPLSPYLAYALLTTCPPSNLPPKRLVHLFARSLMLHRRLAGTFPKTCPVKHGTRRA